MEDHDAEAEMDVQPDEEATTGTGLDAIMDGDEEAGRRHKRARLEGKEGAGALFDLSVVGPNASDRFRQSLALVMSNEWDTIAWSAAMAEAQLGRSGGMPIREVYKQFLKQFPTAGRYWKYYAQLEVEAGDFEAAENIFSQSLTRCASVELWLYYMEMVKRSTRRLPETPEGQMQAREKTVAAYEKALESVGLNLFAGTLWQEYIEYVENWKEETAADTGNKVTALRKIYQRAIGVPMDSVEKIWRGYEAFETVRSEHLAKNKFIPENLPRYQSSKAVFKERKQMWEGINMHILASPPSSQNSEQISQVELWKKRIDYEKTNPERVDAMGLIERVRHTYAQCLCCLRHFPEIWYDVAQFEEESGDLDRAAATYVEAVGVLPKGELLRVAQADLEEARGHLKEARELWGSYLEAFSSSTFAHTLYQRFVRRTEGKNAARKAFSNTLALRKAGKLGYQIYLAHAALEQHINEEPDVAQRILEYGLSQHASFISEPEYVLYYCNFLMERGDEGNLRVLFERVLDPSALPTDKAGDVWERFVQLEFAKSKSGGSLVKTRDVEARRAVAFPDDPTVRGIQGLWKRCSSVGLAVSVLSPADIEAVRRTNPATKDREDARVSRKKRWDAKGEAAGGSDSKREKRKAGGGDKSSSVPPLIPPFLAKVFLSLPRHSGSPYDADEIIWQLKSAAMPSAPEALPDSGRGKKRDQGAGSDESDHENDDRLSGGRKSARGDFQQANDIFRQRQMEKIGVK